MKENRGRARMCYDDRDDYRYLCVSARINLSSVHGIEEIISHIKKRNRTFAKWMVSLFDENIVTINKVSR